METKRSLYRQVSLHHFDESNSCATVQSPPPALAVEWYTPKSYTLALCKEASLFSVTTTAMFSWSSRLLDDQDTLASKPKHYTIYNRPIQLMAVNMKGIWSRQCGLLTTSDWCAAVNPKIINQLTFKKIQWHTFSTNRIRSIFLIIGPSLVRKLSCFFHFLQFPQYWYLPIRVNICAQVKISKQPDDSRTGIGHERTVLIYENTIRPILCLLF